MKEEGDKEGAGDSHFSETTESFLTRKRTAYFYDPDIGSFYYGEGHPMKPQRMRMTHHLVLAYGLYKDLDVYIPHRATDTEMSFFHAEDYVNFLHNINFDNIKDAANSSKRYKVGEHTDCPFFDGLYDFCQKSAGGGIDGAVALNDGHADIAINWSGGLHHAKRSEASGFCYINDIVLAILELLKFHARVLYIDFDVHHGDGVEEAFYTTPRVMTVSFHQFGDFFPGTGDITDVGDGEGQFYSLNVPLDKGIGDDQFTELFKVIITRTVEVYRPGAIVLQCGADSLAHDRLGSFNLTLKGHAECVRLCKSFNLPLFLMGGGGYTIRNVARCWAYETGVALNKELDNTIPMNDFWQYYAPEYELHIQPRKDLTNLNTPYMVDKIRTECLKNLDLLDGAPGVDFAHIPQELMKATSAYKAAVVAEPNQQSRKVKKRQHQAEYYD